MLDDMNFNRCYPDASNFDNIVKIKNIKDWNVEYVKLENEIGYYTADNPFVDSNHADTFANLIALFPIQKTREAEDDDPNPFETIHIPEWLHKDLCFLIRDFFYKNYKLPILYPMIKEWGNIYFKQRSRPKICYRLPHIDFRCGLVSNFWFTDHSQATSGTKIYKYKGKMIDGYYDYMVDSNHKLYKEWQHLQSQGRSDTWFNFSDKDCERWGFECLGMAPSCKNKLTMYRADVSHSPYIDESVDFRWSHTFCYYQKPV